MMNISYRYMKIRLILEVFVGKDDKASQDDYDEVIPKMLTFEIPGTVT
jgi:hypothetical protein